LLSQLRVSMRELGVSRAEPAISLNQLSVARLQRS
jgi:hypothetical protein